MNHPNPREDDTGATNGLGKSTPNLMVEHHRPIYLWAGPGTIRMNRLKFMGAPVDEVVHLEAHTLTGAARVAREADCNWAYLMYDWGFPPEIEKEDWVSFEKAIPVFHAANIRVFGYVQTSNYVVAGSYTDRDWYARDPSGRPFHYYTGRYMTCWRHPHWLDHLKQMVWGVVNAGADGVFFDNPWHATQPQHVGGTWMGSAGCYCARCQIAFYKATGLKIPARPHPGDEVGRIYFRWRADQVTQTLADLAHYARSLDPDILVSANDFDAVMRPSFVTYGIDLEALARIQDVIMIEDYGLPRWEAESGNHPARLTNNALTIRTARALIGETPLSVDPYDKGIGFDEVYASRRFQQAIAEAAACGASMVIKGTEFVKPNGTFTLLTAEEYAPQREAIGSYHRWLTEHVEIFEGRENLAPVGILRPDDALWQQWGKLAPLYFGAGQTLLHAGLPWRTVTEDEDLSGIDVLLYVAPLPEDLEIPEGIRSIAVYDLPGWAPASSSGYLDRHPWARAAASTFLTAVYRAYFRRRWARWLIDSTKITERHFMQSAFFDLPAPTQRETLLEAVGTLHAPQLEAEAPVLIEHWRRGSEEQIHLVNYANAPQSVTLTFGRNVRSQILSPDGVSQTFHGERLETDLDIYTILLINPVR